MPRLSAGRWMLLLFALCVLMVCIAIGLWLKLPLGLVVAGSLVASLVALTGTCLMVASSWEPPSISTSQTTLDQ